MEIIKHKKIICGTILLLFAISGLCNVINVSAEEVDLPPLTYLYYSFDLDYRDELEIYVSSSGTVNVYIMEEYQFDLLVDSGGLIWDYIKRWQDITYLEYVYTIPVDEWYYVVIYNKNVLFGRTVDIEVKRIPYFDIRPIIALIIAASVIVAGIVLVILLKKRSKKKKREVEKPIHNLNPVYCAECGAKITDITNNYCSNCGNKWQ